MDNSKIDEDGYKDWLDANGKHHRDDGPAIVIDTVGWYRAWFQHGVRHRDNGPAVENANGHKAWYQYGVRHRDDGPAIEWANGGKSWYLNDNCLLSFDEWFNKVDISDEDKVMMKLKYG
jgi:hypothetical protein